MRSAANRLYRRPVDAAVSVASVDPVVKLKRVYEPKSRGDGYRVLVERLWPRGIRKEDLALDEWRKEVAPSGELRKWFGHDPTRWPEFKLRYLQELKASGPSEQLRALADRAAGQTLTLIFSSHDTEHNNAVVLQGQIERLAARKR
jgi:uncharacterized protein YeaO (DUF488 family)